ncbi:putative nucleotide-diphospho-sugar transferase [Alteromonas sp. ASW11-36]|uniref:Nucleotide-diphospho-sugar transferase n=1 Tax=Alteromonas arenosi TaxID=3055817 RepID=A0ABT7ST00_9ALTE|nr:putative nucleotide-diphospho-sugar transferase [Alteromonas sp. ASW11-36]MDM7859321.1 putative nucleotide-diphospho-sugar transferase [Alteromonas sp. ASW11-36]
MKKLLILSIALNGYQWLYHKHLASHRRYADKIDADYLLVDQPSFVGLGSECCWLKIHLIQAALRAGYKHVLFLDADAMVHAHTPDILADPANDYPLLMARGRTQRWNSGVILVKNCQATLDFIDFVLAHKNDPIAEQHSVGWGENGHIIAADAQLRLTRALSLKWNNTYDQHCADYIRHFCAGSLRTSSVSNFIHKVVHWMTAKMAKYNSEIHSIENLNGLLYSVIRRYPQFFTAKQSYYEQ